MAEEKKKLPRRSIFRFNLWLFSRVWKYTPGYVLMMIAEGVVWGINNF